MITIRYFGQLRELAGKNEEQIVGDETQPDELYASLREQYHFPLAKEHLRVAVNDEFASWETPIRDGDQIVFIPPVAGG